MKTIAISVIKGGTGKTTTAATIAQAAKADGRKVLLVDMDPQGNLTDITGADQERAGVYSVLHGTDSIAEAIQTTRQGIDILSASASLATERTERGSISRLEKALQPLKRKYDLAIIDTPPAMNELTFNALYAADGLIIPLETDPASINGLDKIANIAEEIKAGALSFIGVIITRYDKRPTVNRLIVEQIQKTCGEIGAHFLGTVRNGVAIREAQTLKRSIYDHAPYSNPALDYEEIYTKIKRSV